jgi:hypothetical protein
MVISGSRGVEPTLAGKKPSSMETMPKMASTAPHAPSVCPV